MTNIVILAGPTSTGKTSLALELCKKYDGAIISADSRQVYKYMDIGTGKQPLSTSAHIEKADNRWIFNGISVWGYDLALPSEQLSAYDFVRFALAKARELLAAGKQVFVVGGTGFFIDAFTGRTPLEPVEPNPELRAELAELSTPKLYAKAVELHIEVPNVSEQSNRHRLIRRIEKALTSSTAPKLSYLPDVAFRYIGLTGPRELLYSKTDDWADAVWRQGLVLEVERLLSLGFGAAPPLHGLVYKSVLQYLEGGLIETDALSTIKSDLHAYIRRQLTYFKKNKDIVWFSTADSSHKAAIREFLATHL